MGAGSHPFGTRCSAPSERKRTDPSPKLSSGNTKTQHILRHFPPLRCSPERCPHPAAGQQLLQACEKPPLGREEGNYMPGEQLIQTLPDPRLKSSPDRSRRCSFIFLKRFADGWKNQCPTEESGGGWSKGKKGREREGGMERRRRERGERSALGEAGGPGGGGGKAGGLAAPAAIVWPRGLGSAPHMEDRGQSKACPSYTPRSQGPAAQRAPTGLAPPHAEHPAAPTETPNCWFPWKHPPVPHTETHSQMWGMKSSRSTRLLGENSPLPCFS